MLYSTASFLHSRILSWSNVLRIQACTVVTATNANVYWCYWCLLSLLGHFIRRMKLMANACSTCLPHGRPQFLMWLESETLSKGPQPRAYIALGQPRKLPRLNFPKRRGGGRTPPPPRRMNGLAPGQIPFKFTALSALDLKAQCI